MVGGVVFLAQIPEQHQRIEAAQTYPVCDAGQRENCLISAEARVVDDRGRRYGERNYHVVPTDPVPGEVEAEWPRLIGDGPGEDGDETTDEALHEARTGDPLTALYWDGRLVRLETETGDLAVNGTQPGAWLDQIWMAVVFLTLACGLWYLPHSRRRNMARRAQVVHRMMLPMIAGASAALFVDPIAPQLLVFGVLALSVALLVFGPAAWHRLHRAQRHT